MDLAIIPLSSLQINLFIETYKYIHKSIKIIDPSMLPEHLRDLLDRTSEGLEDLQRGRLAETLLEFVDLFPVPGSALTGHTEAVEHTIGTGDSLPIRCALRRMSPQKIKQDETCVEEMLAGG